MLSTIAGTGEKLSGPAGLAIDSNGALLVADSGNHCIRKIVNGSMEAITDSARNPLDFGAVTSIALDAAGRLHAAGGTRILVVTSAGAVGAIETAGGRSLYRCIGSSAYCGLSAGSFV